VIPVADRLVDNIAISTCGTDMQKRASSIFMFGFVGISTGYVFPRSKFKVMVKLICDISTISGRDRNLNISILMFGFMGISGELRTPLVLFEFVHF
jgi:hypothetical protein